VLNEEAHNMKREGIITIRHSRHDVQAGFDFGSAPSINSDWTCIDPGHVLLMSPYYPAHTTPSDKDSNPPQCPAWQLSDRQESDSVRTTEEAASDVDGKQTSKLMA
jgi:hypothetical protein